MRLVLQFWADEVFPEEAWWHKSSEADVWHKPLSGDLCITLRRARDWEVDLRIGGPESSNTAICGIDLDRERPDIKALRGWLWKARGVFSAAVGGPKILSAQGPLSGETVCYLEGSTPLDICTDMTQLDWGNEACVILGDHRPPKTLLAYRIARDFAIQPCKVVVFTPCRSSALHTFGSRWNIRPEIIEHRKESTDDLFEAVDRMGPVDLVVVDIPVPGLSAHPQRLAKKANTRVVWTFEGSRPPSVLMQTSALVLETQALLNPLTVLKNGTYQRNYRILPGLRF